nr:hypothetical protein OG365_38295 [Streptomyces sp. NBC_00853]
MRFSATWSLRSAPTAPSTDRVIDRGGICRRPIRFQFQQLRLRLRPRLDVTT